MLFVALIALAAGIFQLGTSSGRSPGISSAINGERPPNIILILVDDVGWGDFGSYGHPYAKTPNIDRLASEGTRFERFYVTGSTCAPSRAGFMTSRSYLSFPKVPADHGFQGRPTITEILSKNGYITGHFGKWNMGEDGENGTYGIQKIHHKTKTGKLNEGVVARFLSAAGAFITNNKDKPYDAKTGHKHMREARFFDAAKAFITENKDKPFYMNVWTITAHTPIESHPIENTPFGDLNVQPEEFKQYMRSRLIRLKDRGDDINAGIANYLYAIHLVDRLIGDLLNHLDTTGIGQNTIVVVTSDQGPTSPFRGRKDIESDSARNMMGYTNGLRGGKHTYFEGGVRSPFIIRWPGKVQSGVTNASSVISAMDWLPTVAHVAGIDIDSSQFEGENISDIWTGSNRSRKDPLIWSYHKNQNSFALLQDDWKLVGDGERKYLFNVSKDPYETSNLYESHGEIFRKLLDTVTKWQASVIQDKTGYPVVQRRVNL